MDNPSFCKDDENVGETKIAADTDQYLNDNSFKVKQKRKIMKNIIIISVSFLFVFNAFQGLQRLQSSLHVDEGMGVINSSIIYASLILSSIFLPKILINIFGHKWIIQLSFVGYILWMAANGYAIWELMTPASILVGLCAAPLWTAQCSYFTICGSWYAKLSGESESNVIAKFFGIFFFFFQCSGITGSIISATILVPNNENKTFRDVDVASLCGLNDCNQINQSELGKPDSKVVWTMLGIYITVAVIGMLLVVFFVDNLPSELVDKKKNILRESSKLITSTFRHMFKKEQILLILITVYSGLEQGFFNAEFNKSFVSCSLGIWKVGLVIIPFGCVNALGTFFSGRFTQYTGRIPIFLTGMTVDIIIHLTLYLWKINAQQEYVFYILSSLWGLSDGIWQCQINALYGILFIKDPESGFSNYRLWESLGFILSFAYSNFLCTSIKLYILSSVLIAGMFGYLAVEYIHGNEASMGKEISVQNKVTRL